MGQENSLEALVQHALANHEGVLSSQKCLTVSSGQFTARHTSAKHIVEHDDQDIHWDRHHQPLPRSLFLDYWQKAKLCLDKF